MTVLSALSDLERDELRLAVARRAPRTALEVGHYYGASTRTILEGLPQGATFWTVDHHQGDDWSPKALLSDFARNVEELLEERVTGIVVVSSFEDAAPLIPPGIEFCFYDACHRVESSRDFWDLYASKLAPHAVFAFDDADWPGGRELRKLAEEDGFRVTRTRPLHRAKNGKGVHGCFTLEVMER